MTFDEARSRVSALDLEPTAYKLAFPEVGDGWHPADVYSAIERYRQFLVLNAVYPDGSIVPTKEIDQVWHTNILDTAKYRQDCNSVFGRFLDHFPYFGVRGNDDALLLTQAFEISRQLFIQHFGIDPKVTASDGADCGSGSCSPSCKASECGGCSKPPDCGNGLGMTIDFESRPSLAMVLAGSDEH